MSISKDISSTEFYKVAGTTAEHFGFMPLDQLKSKLGNERLTKFDHSVSANDRKVDNLYGLLTNGAVLYADARLQHLEEPALFYTLDQIPRSNDAVLSLHVVGVEKSIAEAVLIQTMRSLASDIGLGETTVRINSMGDRDSITRYNRELTNFLKKRLEEMLPAARELMKEHVFLALLHLLEKEQELGQKAPNPMEHLSDPSRKHFREVVEYLDMSGTPYEIDQKLLGHFECFRDTLFALELEDSETGERLTDSPLTVRGGRYSAFTEKHFKEPLHAAGAVAILHNKKAPQRNPKTTTPSHDTVHVVQLGFGPKIRTLMLIDELRKAGILVKQNLASDSLSTQLRAAENDNAAYTIIIGQKEYVDGTVILRDMIGRNQEYVPMGELTAKLKKILKA